MKRLFLLLFVALAASPSFGADGKSVSYKSGDETVQGLLYTPVGKGPFPANIVIHEWWGLNDWIKDQLRPRLMWRMN
jgi:carboxymethylenebutenolidase